MITYILGTYYEVIKNNGENCYGRNTKDTKEKGKNTRDETKKNGSNFVCI